MAYTFDQIEARDPKIPSLVASNALVTIFEPGDPTKTPIAITTNSGEPLANPVQVNALGYGDAFMSDLDRVAWVGGENDEFTGFFTAYEGMKEVAVAAQAAAESAAANAANEASAALAGAVSDAESAQAAAEAAAALVEAPADTAIAAAVSGPATQTRAALSATIATVVADEVAAAVAADETVAAAATAAVGTAMSEASLSYTVLETPAPATTGPTITTLRGTPTYGTPTVSGMGALTAGVLQWDFTAAMRTAMFNGPVTIEAWVRRTAATGATLGILGHGNLYLGMEAAGTPRLRVSATNLSGPTSIANTSWHHLAAQMTLSSDGGALTNIEFYVDGVLVNSNASLAVGSTVWSQPWSLGGIPTAGFDFGGQIDEVRISKVKRYTGTFTPATKHDVDANTVALFHLDSNGNADQGGYFPRPVGADAGTVTYVGVAQPTDWLTNDRWIKL